jgi:hypothetical protein
MKQKWELWESRSLRALDIFRGRTSRKISNARFRDPISKLRQVLK